MQRFQLLENLIDMVPGLFYWMDLKGRVLGCNLAEAEMFGFKEKSELIGKDVFNLVTKEEAEVYISTNNEVIQSGQMISRIENINLKGKLHSFLSKKAPMKNLKGETEGIVGISFDVTEEHESKKMLEIFANSAAQVAHDIRSPLAALNTVLKYLTEVPENQRIMMRNAVNRINDIANNLLQQYKAKSSGVPVEETNRSHTCLLAPLVESMISEKRLPLEGSAVQLESSISSSGFAAFSLFDGIEMKRVLSNVINNAAEAFGEAGGKTVVSLDANDQQVFLKITDNGCGIPPERLAKVFEAGVSFKAQGSGLGLAHAYEHVKAWGGELSLQSKVGTGTTVSINLPRAAAPSWFVSDIQLLSTQTVAVLDDDQSVHDAWDQRLRMVAPQLTIVHFKRAIDLMAWYPAQTTEILILSDYELLGETITGLDALETLKVGQHAILVTSHYENPTIITRCQTAGIRLLPKNLLAHVPIQLKSPDKPMTHYDAIFIDDDATLRMSWSFVAQIKQKKLLTLDGKAAFEALIDQIAQDTAIYIDSELGDYKGEVYAKTLFERGFQNLYLATGHPASHFGEIPWIKAIVGKESPF